MARLDLQRIVEAVSVIDPLFIDSPQYRAPDLDRVLGCALTLKLETANPLGSFKGRGIETVVARVARAYPDREVVCASAGNLGQALAYSAGRRGIAVRVFAAATANPLKVERMRSLGADVHLEGQDIELPRTLAAQYADREGAYLVEDSLDLDTCEGAATIGLELCRATEPFDAVLVALGGGALASGVGFVMRQLAPTTEVIAIQPKGAPAMARSWHERRVVTTETIDTIADGVAGRFPIPEVLDDLLEVVDDAVLVSDDAIIRGMRQLFEHAGLVTEPSAALGIAAILEDPGRFRGRRIATVICGGNVMPDDFRRWVLER